MGSDAGLVGGGDGSDDREPEPVPLLVVPPARVEPLEGLEESVYVAGGDDRAGVGERQDGFAVGDGGGGLDVVPDHVVADGVVDQVGDQTLDKRRVTVDSGGPGRRLDVQPKTSGVELAVQQDTVAERR